MKERLDQTEPMKPLPPVTRMRRPLTAPLLAGRRRGDFYRSALPV